VEPILTAGANDLAVSAAGPDDVWAVGTRPPGSGVRDSTPFAEHYDGTGWTETAMPEDLHAPGMLLWDVEAIGPDDAWAAGGDEFAEEPGPPVVLHWDGTGWEAEDLPTAGDAPYVGQSVSATGPDDVWMVADATGPDGQGTPGLVLRRKGSTWSDVTPPAPQGAVLHVTSLDAARPDDVWAAGSVFDSDSEESAPVIEHFDGAVWTVLPAGLPPATAGLVRSVRVIDGEVWEVGFSSLHDQPFVSVCR
jgi:hypothetical protein